MSVATGFILVGVLLGLLGLWLIVRGGWWMRTGDTPHCRKCDYILTGLDLNASAARCPECGVLTDSRNIVRGERTSELRLILRGSVILLIGFLIGAFPGTATFQSIDWYTYRPTTWVFDDLNDPAISMKAWNELQRRHTTGGLSTQRRSQLADWATYIAPCAPPFICRRRLDVLLQETKNPAISNLVWDELKGRVGWNLSSQETFALADEVLTQMTPRKSATQPAQILSGAAIEVIDNIALRGLLTPEQAVRYFESVGCSLAVKPAIGEHAPLVFATSIVSAHQFASIWLELDVAVDETNVNALFAPAWFDPPAGEKSTLRSVDAVWRVGRVRNLAPSKHHFTAVGKLVVGYLDQSTKVPKFIPRNTVPISFAQDFEVVKGSTIRTTSDVKFRPEVFDHAFIATNAVDEPFPTIDWMVYIREKPTPFAFDVFVRVDKIEFPLGQLISGQPNWHHPFKHPAPPVILPKTVDLVLRSSMPAAERTMDIDMLWDGEIVIPNVPVRKRYANYEAWHGHWSELYGP